jgi:16S rRNA (guanine527-N7)-methyltransferase
MAAQELKDLADRFHLTTDAQDRLTIYHELLVKWQKTVNLVGPKTMELFWSRHLLDSLQLLDLVRRFASNKPNATIADLGTGAGIPGILLALSGVENITLVESDVRKAAFLKEVARATETKLVIKNKRIEKIVDQNFDLILARALAPLTKLFELSFPLSHPETNFIFPKGMKVEEELHESKTDWQFSCLSHKSLSDETGSILEISDLEPRTR